MNAALLNYQVEMSSHIVVENSWPIMRGPAKRDQRPTGAETFTNPSWVLQQLTAVLFIAEESHVPRRPNDESKELQRCNCNA
jgi:hypothetical protein